MRKILTERNLVVFLFGAVLITFSLAENDTKKLEQLYSPASSINFYPTAKPTVEVIVASTSEKSIVNSQ
jgi:hypothetical protein